MKQSNVLLLEKEQVLSAVIGYSSGSRRNRQVVPQDGNQSLNEAIVESLPMGIVVTDAQDMVVAANDAARKMLASQYAIEVGKKCRLAQGVIKCSQRHFQVSKRLIKNGGVIQTLFVISDVTSMAEEIARLKHQSLSDDLTDLYNRRGFLSISSHFIDSARREGRKLLLIFADLDGLKKINDTFGHVQGDLAIQDVSSILKSSMRTSDLVARVGGDEFVILTTVAQGEQADSVVSRLKSSVASFNERSTRPYSLSISFGTAEVDPESDIDLMELLERADCRMYEHKRRQRLAR